MDNVARFVERERGLGQIGDAIGIRNLHQINFSHVRHHLRDLGRLTQRAFDLVVVAVTDEDERIPLLGELDRLNMNLGHQRAGRVNHLQIPPLADLANSG